MNAWNRNIIPWWLLLPQGVSGAIKRRAGYRPFLDVGRHGPIRLGGAVAISAGRLPCKAIIHVAGIKMLWKSTKESIQGSVWTAMRIVDENDLESVAFPVIGSVTGGLSQAALHLMLSAFQTVQAQSQVTVVRIRPATCRAACRLWHHHRAATQQPLPRSPGGAGCAAGSPGAASCRQCCRRALPTPCARGPATGRRVGRWRAPGPGGS